MPRYAAFLRGVMPTNCKMPELRAAFESAGFTDVKTILGSGNVVFTAAKSAEGTLERKAEAAMKQSLGKSFMTIVRPVDDLRALLESDPFKTFRLPPGSKHVVTFLRAAPPAIDLPIELDGARIHAVDGRTVFTSYVRTPTTKGPAFMTLIERTFGKDQTTRTWDTLAKIAR